MLHITRVGQTYSLGKMLNLSTMIGCSENIERISKSERVSFQMVTERNYVLFDDLTCSGREFQRVGTATVKA